MTTTHNPPHPGDTLREDVLPALGLTVTDAAAQRGGDARLWLEQQGAYDLWRVRKAGMPKVKKARAVSTVI
jgi:antitoxin HigA-1